MIIILSIIFVVSIIFFLYLLDKQNSHRHSVLLIVILLIFGSTFLFISKYSLIGSFTTAKMMDDYSKIVAKGNLESDDWENIDEFFETKVKSSSALLDWYQFFIEEALRQGNIPAAETWINGSLENFINLEQSYHWLAVAKKVRNAKYPEYLNTSISININNFDLCEIFAVAVAANIFRDDEPDDPITVALFYEENPVEKIVLTNEDAEAPGIDLTTAFISQDVITVGTVLFCKNNEIYSYGESDIVFAEDNQNIVINIEKDQWKESSDSSPETN